MAAGVKVLGDNRRARHDYHLEDELECGIALVGTEVKSVKAHHFAFNDAYAQVENGQLWLRSFHITPFEKASLGNHQADRPRVLLAHKSEIEKLRKRTQEKGFTLVPVQITLKKGRVKVVIALAKGKKLFDKRETIKARDEKRETDRQIRDRD